MITERFVVVEPSNNFFLNLWCCIGGLLLHFLWTKNVRCIKQTKESFGSDDCSCCAMTPAMILSSKKAVTRWKKILKEVQKWFIKSNSSPNKKNMENTWNTTQNNQHSGIKAIVSQSVIQKIRRKVILKTST